MIARFGNYTLYPGTLFLPIAAAFFLVLFWRNLPAVRAHSRKSAAAIMAGSAAAAFAGAIAMGLALNAGSAQETQWLSLPLASTGAFWGAILGAAIAACLVRYPAWRAAGQVVVPMLTGAMIARIGCLYNGCCVGDGTMMVPPAAWPLLDIAALGVTIIVARIKAEVNPSIVFCLIYSPLRIAAETLRADSSAVVLATLCGQGVLGLIFAGALARRRDLKDPKDVRDKTTRA